MRALTEPELFLVGVLGVSFLVFVPVGVRDVVRAAKAPPCTERAFRAEEKPECTGGNLSPFSSFEKAEPFVIKCECD